MSASSKPDLHASITASIIAAIEAGGTACTLPWRRAECPIGLPSNPLSKATYQGINIVALWASAINRGYPSGIWATYRQWGEVGAQVRKGEKASTVIFYKEFNVEADEADPQDDGRRRFARASSVFNIAQVDGFALPEMPFLSPIARLEAAEGVIRATGADIRHGGDRAYYRMRGLDGSGDFIQMPDEHLFAAADESQRTEDYYSVLLHELTHWTSPDSRCNRDLGKRFGDHAYAMEELVAELGAAFLCAELGISQALRPDHAGYIANWLEVLKADARAIFTAAAKASEAVAFIKKSAAS